MDPFFSPFSKYEIITPDDLDLLVMEVNNLREENLRLNQELSWAAEQQSVSGLTKALWFFFGGIVASTIALILIMIG